MKIVMFVYFKECHEIIKKIKSLYDFGGRCLKIRDVCMDFEPYFKVHNLVSVHPKSIIISQMSNLAVVFHVVVSVWLKFETHPSSPLNFGTAHNFHVLAICALGKMKHLPFWEQLYLPGMLTKLI